MVTVALPIVDTSICIGKVDAEESYYETETDEEGGKSKTAKQDGKERPEKSLDKTKAKEGDSKKQPAPKKKTSGKPGEVNLSLALEYVKRREVIPLFYSKRA